MIKIRFILFGLLIVLGSCQSISRKVISTSEVVSIPAIGIDSLPARIDTGAHLSTLHAQDIKIARLLNRDDVVMVSFKTKNSKGDIIEVKNQTVMHMVKIKSSNGKVSSRPVIMLEMNVAGTDVLTEVSLFNRSKMSYPLLIGRKTLHKKFLVNPDIKQSN